MEKELVRVIFTFAGGEQRILEGADLASWEAICSMHSDYLLPGDTDHVLARSAHGLIQGFVPPSAIAPRGGPLNASVGKRRAGCKPG